MKELAQRQKDGNQYWQFLNYMQNLVFKKSQPENTRARISGKALKVAYS